MKRFSFIFDSDRCFGCLACVVACQQEHQLSPHQKFIDIKTVGPTRVNGKMTMRFIPYICVHCHSPLCIKACPLMAIRKRDDGAVLIDSERCIGCRDCTWACPYQAILFNDEDQIALKCDLCFQRVEKGLLPSCAHHCPAHAIHFDFDAKPHKPGPGRLAISKGVVTITASSHAIGEDRMKA